MTSDEPPSAKGPSPPSPELLGSTEQLLIQVLQEPADLRESTVDALCERHPDRAATLRRQYAFLKETGLLEGSRPSGGSFPERVGDFRLLQRLGEGGMGVVYLAEQEKLDRRVALKLIRPELLHFHRSRERFRREALLASRLDHPGICPIFEAGEADGVPYLAMRYVPGGSLEQQLDDLRQEGRTPDVPAMVALVHKVARALQAAHDAGLVHRDVKPGNIQLGEDGEPVLLDFGLSRLFEGDQPALTVSGDVLGTPAYLAPEQIDGRCPVGPSSDVYSLGVVLYECLTLRAPFSASNRQNLYRQILESEPDRASTVNGAIPADLQVVLEVALDKDPQRRYATAGAFADDLGRITRQEPIAARRISRWLRARRWCQRNPYAATALGVMTAGLVAALVLIGQVQQALEESRAAQRETRSELLSQAALEIRAGNPTEARRTALEAVDFERSPRSVAAVRATLHTPRVEVEVEPSHPVNLAFDMTPDGSTLVWCTNKGELQVWRDGQMRSEQNIQQDFPVFCVRLDPKGERIAVARNPYPARIYDLEGRELLGLPHENSGVEEGTQRVFSVAWHPEGKLLATGTGVGIGDEKPTGPHEVHLWSVDRGTPRRVWRRHVGAWPWHLEFSEDGSTLLAAPGCARSQAQEVFANHDVCAFSVRDGQMRSHGEHRAPCMDMAVSGSLVATVGHDRQLVLWNLDTGSAEVIPHDDRIYTVDFDPSGETLATACRDGRVRFFDRRGLLIDDWSPLGQVPVAAAVFRPDGRAVLVNLGRRGRQLCTLDGRLLAQLPSSSSADRTDYFLVDGRLLTIDFDAIRIWRLDSEYLPTYFWHRRQYPVVSPDGQRYVLTDSDGKAELRSWDGEVFWSRQLPATVPIRCVSNEGRAYAYTPGRQILVVGPDGEFEPTPEPFGWTITHLACAPTGAIVAGSGMSESLRVQRPGPDGRWKTPLQTRGPPKGVLVNPTGGSRLVQQFLWCHGEDGGWRVLCATTEGILEYAFEDDQVEQVGVVEPEGDVSRLALDPSERVLAADFGHYVRILERDGTGWRCGRDIPLRVPLQHLAFAATDRLLLTSNEEVLIYDPDTGLPDDGLLGMLPRIDREGFLSAYGLPGGAKVLTLSAGYVGRVWWLEDDRVLEEARSR